MSWEIRTFYKVCVGLLWEKIHKAYVVIDNELKTNGDEISPKIHHVPMTNIKHVYKGLVKDCNVSWQQFFLFLQGFAFHFMFAHLPM